MKTARSIEDDFGRGWSSFYGDRRPLSWLLREDKSLPWVRFHSLPNSKRYPDNETEKGIILSRAYSLGDAILGADAYCWQIECRSLSQAPPRSRTTLIDAVVTTFADDEENLWCANVLDAHWRQGALDLILLAIANDTTEPTMWMDRQSGRLFAPYDGGFDIFVSSLVEVQLLRAQFAEWLSESPEGL